MWEAAARATYIDISIRQASLYFKKAAVPQQENVMTGEAPSRGPV